MSFGYPTFHSQTRTLLNARYRYEAARSFDLDDDLEFCPALLSEEELQSVHSGSSDGSSLSSGSPNSSPLQHQIQPSSASSSYSYSSHSSFGTPMTHFPAQVKMQQPSSQRSRNAIPIVNPTTGMRVSSPPTMMPHATQRSHHHPNLSSRRPW